VWTAQIRRALATGVALAWVLLTGPSRAFALNPALDVGQYAHTAWRIRDGFSKGTITAIAQTPDGYLWLGTELGMLRFDGVQPVSWQPPQGQQLPSSNIRSLLVARDGALWIGTEEGLARWKDGKLTRAEALTGRIVFRLVEDHEGSIWAIAYFNLRWTLCEIRPAGAECHGDDGGPGAGAISLHEDRTGSLWVGTVGRANGLWRWRPGAPKFYPLLQQADGIRGLSEADDGALLVSLAGGVSRFVDGKMDMAYAPPPSKRQFDFPLGLRDRDGGLWFGGAAGLMHVHEGIMDAFGSSEGLSGDQVLSLFEDREGTIWASTVEGLDRFRDIPVALYSTKQGLSNSSVGSVLAARDGSIWVGTRDRVNRWTHGGVTVYGDAGTNVQSIFQDSLERVWISTLRDAGYLENGRFVAVTALRSGPILSIVEDGDANLWIANRDLGLFRVSTRTGGVDQIPWTSLNLKSPASALAADRARKGLWLGLPQGGVVNFAGGQVGPSYGAADGLGVGRVRSLRLDPDGTVWAATEGGLSRLKDGRVATLTSKNGLPCDAVHWNIEDDDRAMWLGMRCGLGRISRAEMDAWIAAVQKDNSADPSVHVAVFESDDGFRLFPNANYYSSPVVKSFDGKLWFSAEGGLGVVDPRHLPFNSLPPPVQIEKLIADRKTYDAEASATGRINLPALTRDLQIDYAALSLVAPEKNRFRIKLEGHDRDWQDVGTRRQAFYTDLPPRDYRFRVVASNNSGVWNETGAVLDFSVAPAYYQTTWFRFSIVAAVVVGLAALYQLRLRQVARQFNLRLEERVNERTRIARDLHDTLLQSFHGLLFQLQAASNMLPDSEVKKKLESAIDQAAEAIAEGRDAVQNLRASTAVTNDLAVAITTLGAELAATPGTDPNGRPPVVDVAVEGTPRNLHPILRDDIYRIAGEALRNAFRHASAHRIEVVVRYDPKQLQLRVRDDGKGIDPAFVDEPRPGHFGLPGMRERAELVGGTLTVWSQRNSGTEVELTVPAAVVYAKSPTEDVKAVEET